MGATGVRLLVFLIANVVSQNIMADEEVVKHTVEEVSVQTWSVQKEVLMLKAKVAEQSTKICEMEMDIMKLSQKVSSMNKEESTPRNDLEENPSPVHGTSFIRWGRRDCPGNVSELLYAGIAGGSHFTHTGASPQRMCLPQIPQWNSNKHFNGPHWGYMYGAEYEDVPNASLKDGNVPCAVCIATSFNMVLMIPAKTTCHSGWTEAYHGDLSGGYHGHAASSNYVCLDETPQGNNDGKNDNGLLFYPIRSKCGALPCPPYEDDKLLACVVCLK